MEVVWGRGGVMIVWLDRGDLWESGNLVYIVVALILSPEGGPKLPFS